MTPSLPALEQRIDRLERELRWSRLALLVAGIVLVAGFIPRQVPDLIQTHRIQVLDDRGQVRIDLKHDAEETGLFVMDGEGDRRIGAAQFAHGGGGFALHGPGQRGAAVLYLKGLASLTAYDTAGAVAWRIPATP